MDSFEAATQFSQILRGLTPSMQNLIKAAHFALKHSESEDYLFPSIIDVITDATVEINTKSSIFQFIEVLINESFYYSRQPKFNYPYVQNLKSSLPTILLEVLPQSNNINIHTVFNSLKNISKHFKIDYSEYIEKFNAPNLLTEQDKQDIELDIPHPEIVITTSIQSEDPLITAWDLLVQKRKQSQYERLRLLKNVPVTREDVEENELFEIRGKNDTNTDTLSKRQIIARMEDDRESHKRSKENLWIVQRPKDVPFITEEEFLNHYWNKCHVLDEKQEAAFLEQFEELNKLVAVSYKDPQF